MKTKIKCGFTLCEIMAVLAVIALLAASVLPARAAESFNATNIVNNAVVINTDPTNSPGVLTGAAISVPNNDKVGFYIKGYNANANASALTVKLIRSGAASPSISATARDYESAAAITITATTPAAAGPFYFYTNLDSTAIGSATAIGIANITNGTASASFTNADFGVTKKIIPIRYP